MTARFSGRTREATASTDNRHDQALSLPPLHYSTDKPWRTFAWESSGNSLLLCLAPFPKSGSYYFWGIARPNS